MTLEDGGGDAESARAFDANLDACFDRSIRLVEEVFGEYAMLHLLDRTDGEANFRIESYHHADPDRLRHWQDSGGPPDVVTPEQLEHTLDEATTQVVEEASVSDGTPDRIALSALTSSTGRGLGVFLVGPYREPDDMGDRALELVEAIADRMAARLEAARLRTDLSRARSELEEAVDIRDNFISAASHELRSPLSTIQLLAQLLRREARQPEAQTRGVPPESVLERADALRRQVRRMSRLVDRLLNVARLSGRRPRLDLCEVDLVDIVENVLETYRHEEGVPEFRVEMPDSSVGVWDPERLEQLVSNLVSNAVKYGEGRPIDIAVADLGETCQLRVRDRGPGLPEGDRERLFERFERGGREALDEGLGLGLWIVRRIVDAFDGSIDVTSEPGEGTECRVELPKRSLRDRTTA